MGVVMAVDFVHKAQKETKDKSKEKERGFTGRTGEHEKHCKKKLREQGINIQSKKIHKRFLGNELIDNHGRYKFKTNKLTGIIEQCSHTFDILAVQSGWEFLIGCKYSGEGGGAQNHQLDEVFRTCTAAWNYVKTHDMYSFVFICDGPGFNIPFNEAFVDIDNIIYRKKSFLTVLKYTFECERIRIGTLDEILKMKWEQRFEKRETGVFWSA